jgi:dCTP deaminase
MILSDSEILRARERGVIVLDPFDRDRLGSNSYDVTLARTLGRYAALELDARRPPVLDLVRIPPEGLVLHPGEFWLGVTQEYTESHGLVPFLEGRSSVGRLGMLVHFTAGVGDESFCGHWTLEIAVWHPVRVYAGMPVAQILWHEVQGRILRPYGEKRVGGQYGNRRQDDPVPAPSAMWRSFGEEDGR